MYFLRILVLVSLTFSKVLTDESNEMESDIQVQKEIRAIFKESENAKDDSVKLEDNNNDDADKQLTVSTSKSDFRRSVVSDKLKKDESQSLLNSVYSLVSSTTESPKHNENEVVEGQDDKLVSSSSLPVVVTNDTNATVTTAPPNEPVLPEKGSAEAEHNSSMAIFFVLCVLALGILLIHFMLLTNFQYLPESVVIVFLGGLIGLIINLISDQKNWKLEERRSIFSYSIFSSTVTPNYF